MSAVEELYGKLVAEMSIPGMEKGKGVGKRIRRHTTSTHRTRMARGNRRKKSIKKKNAITVESKLKTKEAN